MRWDNVVAFYLALAFIIYITLKGELPVYMGFILSPASVPTVTASAGPVGGTAAHEAAAADETPELAKASALIDALGGGDVASKAAAAKDAKAERASGIGSLVGTVAGMFVGGPGGAAIGSSLGSGLADMMTGGKSK